MTKNKPTCNDVFQHICTNLDRDLNSPQCSAIKKHLDGCPDCVTYLDSLKKTIGFYNEYPVPRLTRLSRNKLHFRLKLPD